MVILSDLKKVVSHLIGKFSKVLIKRARIKRETTQYSNRESDYIWILVLINDTYGLNVEVTLTWWH